MSAQTEKPFKIANDLHSNNCITKQWFKYFGRNLLVGISGVTDKVKEIK